MILRLTVILMLFSMLSHTLLGCGWHHAHNSHAGHSDSCQQVSLCTHAAEEHMHHDHHTEHPQTAEHSEEHPAPQDSDPCQEGRCSYLAATSVKVHEESSSQLVSLLPIWDLLYSTQEKQYVSQMRVIIPAFLFSSPGVRAQAQTTVWLI